MIILREDKFSFLEDAVTSLYNCLNETIQIWPEVTVPSPRDGTSFLECCCIIFRSSSVLKRVCICYSVRQRERERERESDYVSVIVLERERERESICKLCK